MTIQENLIKAQPEMQAEELQNISPPAVTSIDV
jgi:hypothetical protein